MIIEYYIYFLLLLYLIPRIKKKIHANDKFQNFFHIFQVIIKIDKFSHISIP